MTKARSRSNSRITIFLLSAITLLGSWNCRNDDPVSTIDSRLFGVWYDSRDTLGFEIETDGTMRSLNVDTTGFLRYAPPQDTVTGQLTLRIESARSGAISIRGAFKSHTVDSIYTATGTYSFSDNINTLSLVLLLPGGGKAQPTYARSSLGAKVMTRGRAIAAAKRGDAWIAAISYEVTGRGDPAERGTTLAPEAPGYSLSIRQRPNR